MESSLALDQDRKSEQLNGTAGCTIILNFVKSRYVGRVFMPHLVYGIEENPWTRKVHLSLNDYNRCVDLQRFIKFAGAIFVGGVTVINSYELPKILLIGISRRREITESDPAFSY